MLNYAKPAISPTLDGVATRHVDVLNDVRSDLNGLSAMLYAMVEQAADCAIEPAQLALAAQVIDFAASAVETCVSEMKQERGIE